MARSKFAPIGADQRRGTLGVTQIDSYPSSDTATVVYVCTTCRVEGDGPVRVGARLLAALQDAAEGSSDLSVVAVECLSVCKRPCTVAFAAPGKWTYVYGDLPPDTSAPVILEGARLYNETADGLIPWKLRPDALKKGVVSRIPPSPLPSVHAKVA